MVKSAASADASDGTALPDPSSRVHRTDCPFHGSVQLPAPAEPPGFRWRPLYAEMVRSTVRNASDGRLTRSIVSPVETSDNHNVSDGPSPGTRVDGPKNQPTAREWMLDGEDTRPLGRNQWVVIPWNLTPRFRVEFSAVENPRTDQHPSVSGGNRPLNWGWTSLEAANAAFNTTTSLTGGHDRVAGVLPSLWRAGSRPA